MGFIRGFVPWIPTHQQSLPFIQSTPSNSLTRPFRPPEPSSCLDPDDRAMSNPALLRPLILTRTSSPRFLCRRSFATFHLSSSRLIPAQRRFLPPSRHLTQSFRRPYADEAPASSPVPRPKKRAGFFRWTWRLTKLGLVGGAGFLAYNIYTSRNPNDQVEPDLSKKTLVVLGRKRSE